MIGPNMATMLAFVLTDAAVSAEDLAALARSGGGSVLQLHQRRRAHQHQRFADLSRQWHRAQICKARLCGTSNAQAVAVCVDLAQEIARDAEGASHFVTIDVEGLRNDAEARQVAKAVADSAAGQDRPVRRRSQLGPHRLGGGLCGRRLRRNATVAVAGRFLAVSGGHASSLRCRHGFGVHQEQSRCEAAAGVHARQGPLHVLHL